ncbi:zinc finger protein 276 [Brachionichthys hirsutus]|uniref:zinc finger protein 276 n=1 Tax=Brachionichthys hirsutus TaxID=412623 RepID=UPI003604CF7F
MKRRSRLPRPGGEERRSPGSRGRPRKTVPVTGDRLCLQTDVFCVTAADESPKHPESKYSGGLSPALCRLCHGRFSPRSLRRAFERRQDEPDAAAARSPLLFHADFQQLVGVQLDRCPQLSEFICKKCHAKFYKCHSVLRRFLQRVNLPPVGPDTKRRKNPTPPEAELRRDPLAPPSFSSEPKSLHSLVSWAHRHGGSCRSCPDLKEVLEGQCWGSVKAVWACVDGHRYVMDTTKTSAGSASEALGGSNGEGALEEEEQEEEEEEEPGRREGALAQQSPPAVRAQTRTSVPANRTGTSDGCPGEEEAASPAPARLEDGSLSDRVSDEALSDTDLLDPSSEKRGAVSKRRRSQKAPEEPKVKKKPGPKPGWKNKPKPKGEELPNIYKCPHQGCTAVYRAPDGLKKHIKEHHEEVRERPCPHPGCNKVFMIDRYLQRHVKLIHTEERNYICDQCGQTFKQRKHLSVHQMRHSGAKPLQCEVCGFQCRQRASLKYHMTKHKAESDLEFACLICGKRFEKAHNLNVHMSMVHPLTQVEPQRGDLHAIGLTGDQDR